MIKLFRALRSEHRKLWCKTSTGIWLILCAVVAAFVTAICASSLNYVNHDTRVWLFDNHFTASITEVSGEDSWKAAAEAIVNDSYEHWNELSDIIENGTSVQNTIALREREAAARASKIADYRIDNNISPKGGGMWRIMQFVLWVATPLACIISSVAASDMFAGEYSRGTVYMNFARPITRIKQYIAKLLTAWIYGTLLMSAVFFGSAILGSVLLGDDGGNYIGYVNGEIYTTSWPKHCLTVFCCCLAAVIVCITLCASLGTLTRSRAVSAVGASAVTAAAFWLGSAIAPALGIVSGVSIFSCLDLTVPLMTTANYPGLSFADCCVSCGAHLLVFFISGYYFMRRDITN